MNLNLFRNFKHHTKSSKLKVVKSNCQFKVFHFITHKQILLFKVSKSSQMSKLLYSYFVCTTFWIEKFLLIYTSTLLALAHLKVRYVHIRGKYQLQSSVLDSINPQNTRFHWISPRSLAPAKLGHSSKLYQ